MKGADEEIVAALIETKITNNRKHIIAALELKLNIRFITRIHMQLMAACDLGPQWEELAKSRTLFYIDEKGKFDRERSENLIKDEQSGNIQI